MPSAKYQAIQGMIAAKHPIYAKYKGEATKRKLCPYVLGYKKETSSESDPNERVLCYQLDGPRSAKGWRCFDVASLEIVTPPPSPADWVNRPDYSKWQNSVQKPKHKI
jgi:hypothetical protein